MKKLLLFCYFIVVVIYPAFVFSMEQEQKQCLCVKADGKYLQICQSCKANLTTHNTNFAQLKREFHHDILKRQYNLRLKAMPKSYIQVTELQKDQENTIEEFKSIKSVSTLYQLAEAELFRQYGQYSFLDSRRSPETLSNLADINNMIEFADSFGKLAFPTQVIHFDYLINRIVKCVINDERIDHIPYSLVEPLSRRLVVEILNLIASKLDDTTTVNSCDCRSIGYGQIAICQRCQPFGCAFSSTRGARLRTSIVLPNQMPTKLIKSCISILKKKKRSIAEDDLLQLLELKNKE